MNRRDAASRAKQDKDQLSKGWRWALTALGPLVVILVVGSLIIGPLLAPKAKRDLIRSLSGAFHSEVTIRKVSLSFTPQVRIVAEDIAARYGGRTDVPPLAQLRRLTLHAGVFGMFGHSRHFSRVSVEGLVVSIPPDRNKGRNAQQSESQNETKIDELIADDSVLRILPKEAGGEPLAFEVHRLMLEPVARDMAMKYQLDLKNPKPPGRVTASGTVGPWHSGDPGSIPLSGAYQLEKADLGIFQALRGTLSSRGKFAGALNHIEVTGNADVPNFTLRIGEHPLPLHADFFATVDGMNGDTMLHPANIHLAHSTIVANGGIVSKPGEHGKTVTLDAQVRQARIDDFMRLMMKPAEPFMSGPTVMRAHIVVPPEHRPFLEKLHVTGTMSIGSAHYNGAIIERHSRSPMSAGAT